MILLSDYRTYFEQMIALQVPEVKSLHVVATDQDMSERLKTIRGEALPALFIVVPSAQETDTDPDNPQEDNLCLLFLLDKTDPQRRPSIEVLEDTQPLVIRIKEYMRQDYANRCNLMRGLGKMTTTPETSLYTEYSGWSVSFNLSTP